jgi:hypothetical protein
VDASERLTRARLRAADRVEAVIADETWTTFDAERIALLFYGYDLRPTDLQEVVTDIADPYSEQLVHAAIGAWSACFEDPEGSVDVGFRFGRMAGQSIKGAVMIGMLIGLMAADEKATSEDG